MGTIAIAAAAGKEGTVAPHRRQVVMEAILAVVEEVAEMDLAEVQPLQETLTGAAAPMGVEAGQRALGRDA